MDLINPLLTAVVLHVPIGLYSLPVPLRTILVAAVVVVAASFGLIYVAPPRVREEAADAGVPVARWLVALLTTLGLAYLVFVITVAILGRQGLAALNAASLLFWVWTIPLLPIAHCFIGGMYEVSNPFAFIARVLSGGRRLANADKILRRLGYWPAVVMMFLLVEGEGISEVVQNPALLGVAAVLYLCFQVVMGVLLGEEWYQGGEVFHAITALASTIAAVGLRRDSKGRVRFLVGFNPARFLPVGPGRVPLITLWLGGVLADGVRATPLWRVLILPRTQPIFEQMGKFAGVDLGSASEVTLEVIFTWIAFAIFFWVFVGLASLLSAAGSEDPFARDRLRRVAEIVSPALIPIALAYLFAHNLTQLLAVGPLIATARDASASQLGALTQDQIRHLSPGVVWWLQAGTIVLGHVIAVIMAHARLAQSIKPRKLVAVPPEPVLASDWTRPSGASRVAPALVVTRRVEDAALRADLGWLSAMLIYTATSLWILAQPITASGR
jgi:hypothetical protein